MNNYFQPELETMPLEKLQTIQGARLVNQVQYVYDNVKFYHDRMDEAGISPRDINGIEDVSKLPFITKDVLRANILMGCLPFRWRSASESSLRAGQPEGAS